MHCTNVARDWLGFCSVGSSKKQLEQNANLIRSWQNRFLFGSDLMDLGCLIWFGGIGLV